jgi:RNA polymerase sigma-70 factor (ECF subfamily)
VAEYVQFACFYATNQARLWAYLRRLGADPSQAQDIAQDAFMRWMESPAASWPAERARPYLFAIASNLLTDAWRRRRYEVSWDDELHGESTEEANLVAIPQAAWRVLSRRQRQMLWLAYAEQFNHQEIASVCGVAVASVRVLLARARARLATAMESQ